jgi:predicted alpha-1,2-mannosidase
MIYLYNYAGVPYKAQKRVREVLTNLYSATPDGYCGDEDNGQTSAWYVFSSLGFYPVTPGVDEYVLGSPLFDKATLTLRSGNEFTITAKNNSQNNFYIESTTLNGKAHSKNFIKYDDIQNGGTLEFDLSNVPNKNRGSSLISSPFSLSQEK